MCPIKEPGFFGFDLRDRRDRKRDWNSYLRLFAGGEGARYRGEASTLYLSSERAAEEIKARSPDARIIIFVREPVSQMYSMHSECLYQGSEDQPDFERALELEKDRQGGRSLPPGALMPDILRYRRVASYADAIQRYFDAFGRHRVYVGLFEEFRADNHATLASVLEFLDLPPLASIGHIEANPNKVRRFAWLQRAARRTPAAGKSIFYRLPTPVQSATARLLKRVTTKPQARPPLDAHLRDRLAKEMEPEVARLEEVLGRRLDVWRTAPSQSR